MHGVDPVVLVLDGGGDVHPGLLAAAAFYGRTSPAHPGVARIGVGGSMVGRQGCGLCRTGLALTCWSGWGETL